MTVANQTKHVERVETAPRVLLYDVECTPMLGYTYGPRWEANMIEIVEEKRIISFAWKWLGKPEVRCLALPDFPGYKRFPKNNAALIRELHKIISEAHIAIAHNIDGFDDKMANTGFIDNETGPASPHKTIDTLKVARSKFAFSSNKLEDLGVRLGVGRKIKHPGWPMWKGCIDGDPKHWANMRLYNMGDVTLLEKVYLKIRPWMTNHPNLSAWLPMPGCPKCGGGHTGMHVNKKHLISANKKKFTFHCIACGGHSTGTSDKSGTWHFK